jgi:hypothetical protein
LGSCINKKISTMYVRTTTAQFYAEQGAANGAARAAAAASSTGSSSSTDSTSPASGAPLGLPKLDISAADLTKETQDFNTDVAKMLGDAGIQMPPNPILGNDAQGNVTVVNDIPAKAKIEQLFKDNPSLQQRYAQISAQSSAARAASHYGQYMADYNGLQDNPSAQNSLTAAEVARNQAPFHLSIGQSSAEAFFGGNSTSA